MNLATKKGNLKSNLQVLEMLSIGISVHVNTIYLTEFEG
jgi:hypothetical protein